MKGQQDKTVHTRRPKQCLFKIVPFKAVTECHNHMMKSKTGLVYILPGCQTDCISSKSERVFVHNERVLSYMSIGSIGVWLLEYGFWSMAIGVQEEIWLIRHKQGTRISWEFTEVINLWPTWQMTILSYCACQGHHVKKLSCFHKKYFQELMLHQFGWPGAWLCISVVTLPSEIKTNGTLLQLNIHYVLCMV